jgi:hypothetical protein
MVVGGMRREQEMNRYQTYVLVGLAALMMSNPGQAADGARAYAPDLGDFMGFTQLRHFKLWYAGRSKNWELADYEIEQIRKSFESVKVFYPTLGDVDMAKMIEKESYAPLDALKKAVAARDERGFGAQFDKLTAACNACHEATHFDFIRIIVPTSSPFSNELFTKGSK